MCQTLVAVRGRTAKRQQCRSVLQNAADSKHREFAQTAVTGPCKQRMIVLAQLQRHVQPGTVVVPKRLWHKRGRLAVLCGDVSHDVFES